MRQKGFEGKTKGFSGTLVSFPDRGPWGDPKYRGNCSGFILKALIEQYNPSSVADYMCGSDTSGDVCQEMGVQCISMDLNPKYGGFNILKDDIPQSAQLQFSHPAYHDIVVYSGEQWKGEPHPDDLSRCKDWPEFIQKWGLALAKLYRAIPVGGRVAWLGGDIKRKDKLYSMLLDSPRFGTLEQIIVKAQHNCWSYNVSYSGNFIPIHHEYLVILRKDDNYMYPISIVKAVEIDLRTRANISWRDVVQHALHALGGRAKLSDLYNEVASFAKTKTVANPHWRDKVRQVLQTCKNFVNISRGEWALCS
jgi:hypothetical protein